MVCQCKNHGKLYRLETDQRRGTRGKGTGMRLCVAVYIKCKPSLEAILSPLSTARLTLDWRIPSLLATDTVLIPNSFTAE
jgi:hypothetical protein